MEKSNNRPDSQIKSQVLRHYCTHCGSKKYSTEMVEVYYPLLRKSAWHCQKCLSTSADKMHQKISNKKPFFIEFFAGSKTVSKVAGSLGYDTFTIDIEPKFQPDLVADIAKIKLTQIPGVGNTSILWASVPCTHYSILNIGNHWEKLTYANRKYFYIPKTREARSAISLLEKTLYLIRKINPTYYFIENPRGALRHMPQMKSIPFRHTVSYNDYGLEVYKPTDIFTNCPFVQLKEIKSSVGREFSEKITDLKNAYIRSIVPGPLIESILNQIIEHHKS